MTDNEFVAVYNDVDNFSTLMEIAEYFEISKRTVSLKAAKLKAQYTFGKSDLFLIDRSLLNKPVEKIEFSHKEIPDPIIKSHTGDGVKRFILTSAQDCTSIHEGFFNNLLAYNKYLNRGKNTCEMLIAGYTYNKSLFEDHDKTRSWFDERIRPYLVTNRVNLGDDIVFCGEMNTLPTAVSPLSGFESYTKAAWGIFPHSKVQLVSVATQKHNRAKQIMTTGTITKPNYVQKKAGIKAQFHHILGAVLVEICKDGTFFCRHLIGDSNGSFYDLDRLVENEEVSSGNRVEAIVYGDIHTENIDPVVYKTTWSSKNCLVDYLKPRYQFFHDVLDFEYRNHHNIKDIHHRFRTSLDDKKTVEESINIVGRFIDSATRDFCKSVIVQSNHDNALLRWLKEADYREDPVNAIYFLKLQLRYYESILDDEKINIFKNALEYKCNAFLNGNEDSVEFVDEDSSFIICGDQECGIHGHLGANGSRGSAKQFTRMGVKTNTGHTHTPQILDGAYVAGTNSRLDLEYAKGQSSWAHADIVVYPNGKRTILTLQNGKWYA